MNDEFFYARGRDATGRPIRFEYYCKPCKRRYQSKRIRRNRKQQLAQRRAAYRQRMERIRSNPIALAEERRRWREKAARYRKARPDLERARRKRYHAKLRKDKARYQNYLEGHRIAHRLRREREDGIPLDAQRQVNTGQRLRETNQVRLPIKPMMDVLEGMLALSENGNGRDGARHELCEHLEIERRTFYAWEHGERQTMSFRQADAILTRLGLHIWDVWSEDEYPEIHERLEA